MGIKNVFGTIIVSLILMVTLCGYSLSFSENTKPQNMFVVIDTPKKTEAKKIEQPKRKVNHAQRMYELLEKYSDKYDIPKYIVYNIAYLETKYRGPNDINYNPYQTSGAGAQGPMQVITRYARPYTKRSITPDILKTDLELNIDISCKMIVAWHKIHKRWDYALGAYNSGKPILNSYAIYGSSTLDYKAKWIKKKEVV